MNNPTDIYKRRIRGKKVKPTYEEACRNACYDLYCSLTAIPLEYPILGDLVSMFKRVGKPSSSPKASSLVEDFEYKTQLSASQRPVLSSEEVVLLKDMIVSRYGIEHQEIEEVSMLMRKVHMVPILLVHPVFERLSEVDYGQSLSL